MLVHSGEVYVSKSIVVGLSVLHELHVRALSKLFEDSSLCNKIWYHHKLTSKWQALCRSCSMSNALVLVYFQLKDLRRNGQLPYITMGHGSFGKHAACAIWVTEMLQLYYTMESDRIIVSAVIL